MSSPSSSPSEPSPSDRAAAPRHLTLRFAGFYGAVFLVLGAQLPYWPLWLEARGLSGSEVGVLLAAAAWIKVAANPLAGYLTDVSGRSRLVICTLMAIGALGFLGFGLAQGFWMLLALQILTAGCFQALLPLGESQALAAVRRHGLDYGRSRLWGSVTFVAGVLAIGGSLDLLPVAILPWLLAAGLGLALIAALALPVTAEDRERPARGDLKRLLSDPPLLWFLLAAALVQASHAAYYAFSAIAWRAAGHGTFTIGWLWTEGVLAEILFFALSSRVLARVSFRNLILLAAAGGLLRWGVTAMTTALPALAAVQLLHAATFAATHLAAVHVIAARAPGGLAATGQSLYASVSGGVLMGAMMLAVGPLYDRLGLQSFYVMAGLCGLALLLILAAPRASSTPEQESPP
ncbi:MAG: MFS transporter [Kiloniellales bacterium]|nr:MFS transporter [Kiloniellales bacterium]